MRHSTLWILIRLALGNGFELPVWRAFNSPGSTVKGVEYRNVGIPGSGEYPRASRTEYKRRNGSGMVLERSQLPRSLGVVNAHPSVPRPRR